jgi:tyrosinase-like protein
VSGSPRIRKRIDRLSEPEQETLKAAFEGLMKSPDPRNNYRFWAGIHGRCCPHRCELFLPWHRAYLFAFENALRSVPGCADVTLPFWDWTVIREIPPLVMQDPLKSDRDPHPDPKELPTRTDIDTVLLEADYRRFGGFGCSADKPRAGGDLENEHGIVHPWVGPVMAKPFTAAHDPLFWFHHSYVDRAWDAWQHLHAGGPVCLDIALPGIPGGWRVRDVLDIGSGRLGYSYEDAIRFASRFQIDADSGKVQLPVRADALGPRPRIAFEGLVPHGHGELPIALEVQLIGTASDYTARVSLFGLHGHHDGTAAEHGPNVLPDCDDPCSGSFAASFKLATTPRSGAAGLTIAAQWPLGAKHRAGVEVGAVSIGDV